MTSALIAITSQLWPVLLDLSIRGTALLLLAFFAAIILSRSAAAGRHLIWLMSMIGLLLLPLLTALLPAWHVILFGSAVQNIPAPLYAGIEHSADASANLSSSIAPSAEPLPISSIVVAIWSVGVILALLPLFVAQLNLLHLARTADAAGDREQLCSRLCERMGIRRRVRVLLGGKRSMPMTWGILRPRLLLPKEAADWSDEKWRIVLTHELAHVRRLDCLAQLIASLACAMHWFNPLAWLAAGKLAAEREAACDDIVLNLGANGPDYAEELVRIAAQMPLRPVLGAAAIGMARSSKLERRVRAILNSNLSRASLNKRRMLLTILTTFALLVPIAIVRTGHAATTQEDFKPRLQFRFVVNSPADGEPMVDPNYAHPSPIYVSRNVILDERSVEGVSPQVDPNNGHFEISVQFTQAGGAKFAKLTTDNIGRRLAVILDGKLLMSPTIQSPITGGDSVISGGRNGYTEQEAAAMVDIIESAIHQAAGVAAHMPLVRHFVLLVVAPDRMTFQGKTVTWDQLPDLLGNVPDRAHTVLSFGYSSSQVTIGQYDIARVGMLAKQYGFEYMSEVGQQPIGSKGGPDKPLKSVADSVRDAVNTISTLTDGDPRITVAWELLRSLPEAEAVNDLTDNLKSDINEVRRAAIYILWKTPYQSIDAAVEPLTNLCDNPEDYTRGMAAMALGAHHVLSAEGRIETMAASDSSPYARRCAAYALGLMNDPSALPTLQKAANDPNAQVAANARLAIRMLQTPTK
jgi:beta-lactamase regulating signal transducer with metallopeptidase domain